MSVTFAPSMAPVTGFRIGCSCPSNRSTVTFGTYADAEEFYKAWQLGRTEKVMGEMLIGCQYPADQGYCDTSSPFIKAITEDDELEVPEVNMSNTNSIKLLELLGLLGEVSEGPFGPVPVDACGAEEAEEFLGRVLTAQALSVGDPGRPEEREVLDGGALVIHGGTPEGYADQRLQQLREIAQWAKDHGRMVTWS